MIGDIKWIGDQMYLIVNKQGTLEKLPKMKWYKQLWLYIKFAIKNEYHLDEVRKYARGKSE